MVSLMKDQCRPFQPGCYGILCTATLCNSVQIVRYCFQSNVPLLALCNWCAFQCNEVAISDFISDFISVQSSVIEQVFVLLLATVYFVAAFACDCLQLCVPLQVWVKYSPISFQCNCVWNRLQSCVQLWVKALSLSALAILEWIAKHSDSDTASLDPAIQ